jgi:hypothetical protein
MRLPLLHVARARYVLSTPSGVETPHIVAHIKGTVISPLRMFDATALPRPDPRCRN